MKVKLLIPSCFFLIVLSITAKAQTKEETEKWIVEKLNKYMKTKIKWAECYLEGKYCQKYSYKYIPLGFIIQGDRIITKWNYIQTHWATKFCDGDYVEKTIEDVKYTDTLPINLIKRVVSNKLPGVGGYDNVSKQTAIFKGDEEVIAIISEGGKYEWLFIYGNEEDDFLSRLQKAIAHLKTFYPKPKETF